MLTSKMVKARIEQNETAQRHPWKSRDSPRRDFQIGDFSTTRGTSVSSEED
jgi:hypothetical protein